MKSVGIILVLITVGIVTVMGIVSTSNSRRAELPARALPNAAVEPVQTQRLELRDLDLEATTARRGALMVLPAPEELASAAGGPARSGELQKLPTLAELQEFREYVRANLQEIRTKEASGKLRALEQRAAKMDRTLSALEERLDLTPLQSNKLRSVLLSQLDLETYYVRQWEQGAEEEDLGILKANDRAAHVTELAEFLTAKQLATYLSREGRRRGK